MDVFRRWRQRIYILGIDVRRTNIKYIILLYIWIVKAPAPDDGDDGYDDGNDGDDDGDDGDDDGGDGGEDGDGEDEDGNDDGDDDDDGDDILDPTPSPDTRL